MEPAPQPMPLPDRILLYDGVCAVCNWTVKVVLAHERGDTFRFAALQGETAARLKERHPEIPEDIDTIVIVEDGVVWLRSAAVFRGARLLRFPWPLVRVLWVLPRPLTDLAYTIITRRRYRLFGKYDHCPLPEPEQAHRFLP